MPEQPEPPPAPDALRRGAPAPEKPRIDPFNDPFNPPPQPVPTPESEPEAEPAEEKEKPESGLAEFDAPHAFASVLGSGLGRVGVVMLTCMLAFALTASCYRASLILHGWQTDGFSGFFSAIFAVPGSLFTGPGEWIRSLGAGITDPAGVPYILLVVGGVILAVRSEIHIVSLMIFYAMLTALYAAAYFRMTNPFSLLLWIWVLVGFVWLYRWYWKQQIQIEEEAEPDEE